MPSYNHSTSFSIYGNELRKYQNKHPSFNWNEIECKLRNTNISMNNKSSTMKLFEDEWFIQDSELIVSFDLSNGTGTFLRRVWEINIPELFKATETEQRQVKTALGSVRGVATQKFRNDYSYKDTIQVHMERYSTQLSNRKNDFVESVLLKNTSSRKRSRMKGVKEETTNGNKYFVEKSNSSVCFDTRYLPEICMDLLQGGICSRSWKLEGEILEVNLTELSKATKAEQNQVELALGGIMGEVVETDEVSSIDSHLQRYSERLSNAQRKQAKRACMF